MEVGQISSSSSRALHLLVPDLFFFTLSMYFCLEVGQISFLCGGGGTDLFFVSFFVLHFLFFRFFTPFVCVASIATRESYFEICNFFFPFHFSTRQ